MGNRWGRIAVYIVATAVLAAGIGILVTDQTGDSAAASADELPTLAPMPFAAHLSPVGPTNGRVGSTLTFEANGYTDDPISTIELWDGGRRIESQTIEAGHGALLTLPALSVGQHAVYAKVIDANGEASLTAPVPVDVIANGSEPVAPVEVTPDEGETIETLARRLDVDIDRIAVMAADAATLAPEDALPLPLLPADIIPTGATVTARPDGDAGLDDAISPDAILGEGDDGAGTSPGDLRLTATTANCSVELAVSGASGHIDFWDGTGASVGWQRTGQRTGNGTVTVPATTPGVHLFFATSKTETTSPIQITMPATCAQAVGWTGDVMINDGILTVNRQVGAGRRWLYLQVDGGTAVRVPASGDLPPIGFHTDIGAILPPLGGKSLDVELWHGDEFLDSLVATGHLEAPDGGSIADVIGESRQLELALTEPAGPQAILQEQDRELTFAWTAGPRIEAVLYQILVNDQPITQTNLPPEEIIASGVSVRDSAGSDGSGTFVIDTADIPGRTETGRDAGVTPSYAASGPQVIGTKITASTKPVYATPIGSAAAEQAADPPILIDLPSFGDDVYVRAIGLSTEGSGVVSASNAIRVQLPTPQGLDGAGVDFVSGTDFGDTTFDPGHFPVRAFQDCVWADVPWTGPINFGPYIDRSPHGQTARIESMSAAYPTDGTYCPADFPPPPPPAVDDCPVAQFVCDAWAGVIAVGGAILTAAEAVYSFASSALTTVVDKIAGAVAKYTGVCAALGEVSDASGKTCGAVLTMATKAAISALLVSVGVPPVLPDPGILTSVVSGDFASVAVALMEASGIPCSTLKPDPDLASTMDKASQLSPGAGGTVAAINDPCRAIATALVNTVKSSVLTKAQTAIAQGAGLPYNPIYGGQYAAFTLTPSPLGKTGTTRVTLRMQPRDDNAVATGVTCWANVRVVAVSDEGGPDRTVVPTQVIAVNELPAPNTGRWERTVLLNSTATTKDVRHGTWHLRVTTPLMADCRLASIDVAGDPETLPNYALDRTKGQPTVPAAHPGG